MAQFSGPRLREIRVRRDIKPERLALAVDRSAETIKSYELGRVSPPVSVVCAIADELGVPVGDLFVDDTERIPA